MINTPRRIESLKNQRKIQYQNPNENYITKTARKSVFVKFPTGKRSLKIPRKNASLKIPRKKT